MKGKGKGGGGEPGERSAACGHDGHYVGSAGLRCKSPAQSRRRERLHPKAAGPHTRTPARPLAACPAGRRRGTAPRMGLHIHVDGDACPVREETFRVARRHGVPVTVVANQWLRTPPDIAFQRVDDGFDAADNWIAERAGPDTVVVTADILLASRCLEAGASVVAPNGKPMDSDTISSQIAVRAIMADLRDGAEQPTVGGPPPFGARDRSRFLETLHLTLERLARGR